MIFDTGIEENLIRATIGGANQSGWFDEILKLPTYASYKLGDFEYQFKAGTPIGKKRKVDFNENEKGIYMYQYGEYDCTYFVIYEKNTPLVAYESTEWNIKEEMYDSSGIIYRTYTYSGGTVTENTLNRYNWSLRFDRTQTIVDSTSPPTEHITNWSYSGTTYPFSYNTIITPLSDESLKEAAMRLYSAIKSLS